jgi:hypothetical protein
MSALMTLAQATAAKVESMREPMRMYEREDRRTPLEDRKCFYCGEMGHQYASCPKKA